MDKLMLMDNVQFMNSVNKLGTKKQVEELRDEKVTDLIEIPKQLQHNEEMLQNKDQLVIRLKELHMKQQTQIVKEINIMSQQSKKIIDDITVIEADIDKYQIHIDQWIKKIEDLRGVVEKVKKVRGPFKLKCSNMSKIKDYLSKEIKKQK